MRLLYQHEPVFIQGLYHQLGSSRHELVELKSAGLLAGSVETLGAMGYRYCFGLGENETLLSLALNPLSTALRRAGDPRALVFQHCHAESAVLPWFAGEDGALRMTMLEDQGPRITGSPQRR